jgi:penicillin-binding protein 1C
MTKQRGPQPKNKNNSHKHPPLKKVESAFTGQKSFAAASVSVAETKKRQPAVSSLVSFPLNIVKSFIASYSHAWQKSWQKKVNQKNQSEPKTKKVGWLRRHPVWARVIKIIFFPITNPWLRYSLAFLILVGLSAIIYMLQDLPSPRRLTSKENYAVSTQIFDRNGVLLYEIFGDEHRIPVDLETLPPYVKQATIAIEDRYFYHHFGFDVKGITRAIVNNFQGKPLEGGSTITQQLVKNALLSSEKTYTRKIKEAVLAVATELIYSKEEIIEMYLNYISYGGTSVGIEAASEKYFGKHAKDLDLAEATLLAGLPQAPSKYSPFGSDPQQAKARQAEVLRRMVEDKYITSLQAEEAKAEVLKFALSKTDIQAPHFVFYVRDLLYEKYGVDTVEKGGLRVTTSLDLNLQNVVQASLSTQVKQLERHNISNGAAMVTKPNTGEILAMIGSKDYFNEAEDGNVNVTLALRQPGSSIKPIMYATAFQEKLLNPGSMLLDIPTCFNVPGQKPYCPKNYDGSFHGPVNIRTSLGNSYNIPAVKALRLIGLENFIKQATKMGITTWKDPANYGLSLTLGGGEIRMIDSVQAFSVLADEGVKVPLTPILKIEDYRGNLIDQVDVEQRKKDLEYLNTYEDETEVNDLKRVMDRAPAYLTAHIMQDNNARQAAFGPKSKLIIPNQVVSVKTGTTNNLKDNWTVGFTPEFLTITWVGNNDGSPMNPYLVSGVTGAAPIWNDIMSYVLKNQTPIWQDKPADAASAPVCSSGMPAQNGDDCKMGNTEMFWIRSKPTESKIYTKEAWIKADTGLPPASGDQDNLVLESHTFYSDPLTPQYCVDCRRAVNDQGKVQYEQHTVSNETIVKQD